jgi:pyruvate dehydrogenase E1 component
LGGYLPQRRDNAAPLEVPGLEAFDLLLKDSGDREMSTTMAFVRLLSILTRDKKIGKNIVPIVPDEARTFGMEGLFRQLGIYSSSGQLYEPEDSGQVMWYREDTKGQILQEGINEAGAMAEWIAAGTAYANHGINMVPFYIYYSMFGFQRIGDLAWAAGDIQARGFLVGGTAGRTTLNGEGLQHQDGHSLLMAHTIPNCVTYDPCYAYEMAVIVQDGMRRMFQVQENVFYYLTAMNENYHQPAMPEGSQEGILKGIYRLKQGGTHKPRVQLLGAGTILREVEAAADLLEKDWGVSADVWSVTSFTELAREGDDIARWNLRHPDAAPRVPFITAQLESTEGPVIASTDYIRAVSELVRGYVPRRFVALGTDGFGRSDTREALRAFFEVDRFHVVHAALAALAADGVLDKAQVAKAMQTYGIDPERPNPLTL